MILCLTPNPAIDRTLIVPHFAPGAVQRAAQTIVAAGGKGLNVSRAIRNLGDEPFCMGFLGGRAGQWVADLAKQEGLQACWTWVNGETRMCIIVAPRLGVEPTVINELGPAVDKSDWERLTVDVLREAATTQFVCLSGSLPVGPAVNSFAALIEALILNQKQVWVDTSGEGLEAALRVRAVNVKVNGEEIGALLGMPVTTAEAALTAARILCQRGVRTAVITLGRQGAVMANGEGAWRAQPLEVKVVSAVGSGDSFLGGLLMALNAGQSSPEALRWAVASGTANALSAGGGQFTLAEARKIWATVQVARYENDLIA